MGNKIRRLSQPELFAAIFFELSESLGDKFSSTRLMDAANQLTKLIEKEFQSNISEERPYAANYFSHETFLAMETKGWQVLTIDNKLLYLDDEIMNPLFLRNRLRDLGVVYD